MYPHWRKTPENEAEWLETLANLARFLRGPQGCPWDREQGSAEFARFTAEETRELIEAIETGDDRHVQEELGDVLFCVLAAIAAAEEEGRANLRDCLEQIHTKMIRRHGHVFGEHEAASPEDAVHVWNSIKAEEKRERENRDA